MPDKDSIASKIIQQALGSQEAGYNPSLTSEQMDSQANKIVNQALSAGGYNTSLGQADTPTFRANPEFNTSDMSMINKDLEASDSWFKNTYNDFLSSYYTTQLNTIQGKEEAGDAWLPTPWSKLEGPQAVLDLYVDRIADLDKDRSEGRIDDAQYNDMRQNLEKTKADAERQMVDYKRQEGELQGKIDNTHVSKKFKLEQALVNQQGDAASTWDRMYYSTGNMVGSSASLMLPNFLATFGNKAAQNLIKVGIVNAIPVAGEVADGIAAATALIGAVGETIWSRGQETYAEIAGPIQETRSRLTREFMEANNLTDESQISPEVMRKIRIQSRQGLEQQFRENMMLAVGDIASATLLPFSNMGYGIGKTLGRAGKYLGAADKLASEAAYYGKWAKLAGRVGKGYAETQLEGFEEGLQYAAEDRAKHANEHMMSPEDLERQNSWGNTIKYAMEDGFDTIASIDLVPGQGWSNLGGKYGKDAEFQASTFGGQFLGTLMSGPLNMYAMGKDIQRFRAANKDLQTSGVLDVDGKFQALRNSVLEKYFKNGQVEYLAGALRDLKSAKRGDGTPLMDPAEIDKTAKDIKSAYELYQDVNDHVNDRVGHDKMFGLFDTKDLAVAKDKLRSDIFNAATNITMHTENAAAIAQAIVAQKTKDGVFALQDVIDNRTDVEAQLEAAKAALDFHENRVSDVQQYNEPHWLNKINSHIKTLKAKVDSLTAELATMPEQTMTPPSAALADLYASQQATELYLKDAKEKYAELGAIRTKDQLKSYVNKNVQRPVPPASPIAPTPAAPTQAPTQAAQTPAAPVAPAPLDSTTVAAPEDLDFSEDTQVSNPIDPNPENEKVRVGYQQEFRKALDTPGKIDAAAKTFDADFRASLGIQDNVPLDIVDVFPELSEYFFADDHDYLRKNFNRIVDMLAVARPQTNVELDPFNMVLVAPQAARSVPPIQSIGMDDLNADTIRKIRIHSFEPGTGQKVTNALSVSQKNIEGTSERYIDQKIHGDVRDEDGSLQYSDINDQQVNNTSVVSVGDKLTYALEGSIRPANLEAKKQVLKRKYDADIAEASKVDTKAKTAEQIANLPEEERKRQEYIDYLTQKYEEAVAQLTHPSGVDTSDTSDANYDQVVIGVYKDVSYNIGGNNLKQKLLIGYLPTVGKVKDRLAESSDLATETEKLRSVRQFVISTGRDVTATVTGKGFGYLNTHVDKTTIATAVGADTRPYITIIDSVGSPITKQGTKSVEIKGMGLKPGAVVLMLPNNIGEKLNGKPIDTYIPIYVTKGTISKDKKIHDLVFASVSKYLTDGALQHVTAVTPQGALQAEAYIFTTTNAKDFANMNAASGAFLRFKGDTPAITIGGNTYTADDSKGLYEALGGLYVNVSKQVLESTQRATYEASLKESALLSTNVQANPTLISGHAEGKYAFLTDGQQYQYFSQHTVGMGEVEGMEVIAPIEEIKAEDAEALVSDLNDLGISLDDLTGDPAPKGIKARLLVSPDIPASMQSVMIDSIASMLYDNKAADGMTNIESVKKKLEASKATLDKTAVAPNATEAQKTRAAELGNLYGLMLTHFDELSKRAKKVLRDLGYRMNTETDFYENFEEQGEGTGYRDNSEENSTRNQVDYLPSDIKKLIYFLPEMVSLDLTNPADTKIYQETGKNYKVARNILGLTAANNFNDTWQKVLTISSQLRLPSSDEGFDALLTALKNPDNAPVVQELALLLEKVPKQLQNSFFRNVYLQMQKNVTLLHSIQDVGKWVNGVKEKIIKKLAYVTRSDRKSGVRKIVNDLRNEFRANKSILLTALDEAGKEIYVIDTEKSNQIMADAVALMENPKSFKTITRRKATGTTEEAGNYFEDNAKIAAYHLVKRAGLNITFGAFDKLLSKSSLAASGATGERNVFRDLFMNKLFATISTNVEIVDGLAPLKKNDPFVKESSVINAIAMQEYQYRADRSSGAYRMDGKSYFPWTRHNVISEQYLDLVKGSEFVKSRLQDVYAKRSRILNMIEDPTQSPTGKSIQPTLSYELGARNRDTKNPVKLLKDMTPREHTITRVAMFQNEGKNMPEYLSDTMSDKVTKPIFGGVPKVDIAGYKTAPDGRVYFTDNVNDTLMNYFYDEYDRIRQVERENVEYNDPKNGKQHKIIKNYHDVIDKTGKTKMGMGKIFHTYYFLNKAFLDVEHKVLSSLLYNADGTLKDVTTEASHIIKDLINKHFNALIKKNKKDWEDLGLFDVGHMDADVQSVLDHNYLTKGVVISDSTRVPKMTTKGVLFNLGVALTYKQSKAVNEGRYMEILGPDILNKAIDFAVIDYVVNSAINTNEQYKITGDPAQAGKPIGKDDIKLIEERYAGNAPEIARQTLKAHIESTFTNVSKRNAGLLASGEKLIFRNNRYALAIANDISINSEHMEDYKRMFPDNVGGVEGAYGNGDLTDAQELTTVEEHLEVMMAMGKISMETYRKALFQYDHVAYGKQFPGSGETITDAEGQVLKTVMQPMKPVQRTDITENGMSKQYYIKTSSYPLIPSLVRGTPMESLLNDMRTKGVQRVAFVSGVKQGVAGSKNLFTTVKNEDGTSSEVYNSAFLENNINTLDRSGFRIQLEKPYDASHDHVREGTQQSKLMFVDTPHNIEVEYRGKATKVGELADKYIDYHRRIFNNLRKALMEEIANEDGTINTTKLSKILQEEGEGRGYSMNTLVGLDLREDGPYKGQFNIPLTFLPNVGQMEPVITAIVSNRITRLKMPGKPYIQGSEVALRTGKKGRIEEGTDLDRRGIVWTKPEYHGMNKLGYLHVDKDGVHHNAQIVIPFYFVKDGQKLEAASFTKQVEDAQGRQITVLDTDKIDPELLQINGFRIPFQGHNSGMWFEIVGFLPSTAGDLALVPGEIAGQMGSDYDVDVLYSYNYNYQYKESFKRPGVDAEDFERIKRLVNQRLALDFDKGEDGKYSKADYTSALAAVLLDEHPDGVVPTHEVTKKGASNYEIAKLHEEDPRSTEALQNALIDIQKAIYTAQDPGIMRAILDPLSFKDVQAAITLFGAEGTSTFLGSHDPIYQRDMFFSNVAGKLGTAICANANTSHAMAQTSNLYVKGQGVVMLDENGAPYADRTGQGDTNRVNDYRPEMYQYSVKVNDVTSLVDQNMTETNSAWRLDKIYTFPDPVTGVVHKISNLISQLLGVSVDNAKEQLLGAFGINAENLNVVLTLIRAGFTLNVAKVFVNQPILKDYYAAIGDADDMYNPEFIAGKMDKLTTDLYTKYAKIGGISSDALNDIIDRKHIVGQKFSRLTEMLGKDADASNALEQIEILKAYYHYKDISSALATLTGTFGIDVKGLPKNIADTAVKANQIRSILSDSPVLGNVSNYDRGTIPGVFSGVPDLAVSLFMAPTNPLFAYNTVEYNRVKEEILLVTGKKGYYADQVDTIHNHLKSFIYSGFRFPDGEDIVAARKRLLFDEGNNQSLQTRLLKLRADYPRNELLQSLVIETSDNPSDPKLISIESSTEENYVQKIQEHWTDMMNNEANPQLQMFARDLLKYATWIQPQEFGISSMGKYLILESMIPMGFSDYLHHTNSQLNTDNVTLVNFTKQFLRHNVDFLLTAKEEHFQGKPDWVTRQEMAVADNGEPYMKTLRESVNKFTLPAIVEGALATNKAASLVRDGAYPKYLKFFTKDVKDQMYEGFKNVTDGTWTYYRVSRLGATSVDEYNMTTSDYETIVGSNYKSVEGRPQAVAIAMPKAGAVNLNEGKDYVNLGSINDVLGGLITKANEIASAQNTSKTDRSYARYYAWLATQLQGVGLSSRIVIDDSLPVGGRYTPDTDVIQFSAKYFKQLVAGERARRSGLSGELEKQRIVLHELFHAAVAKASREQTDTEAYKKIEEVHAAFKKAVSTSEVIRGVDMSALDAELFSALKDGFDTNKKDEPGTTFADFINNVIEDEATLRRYFGAVGARLEAMAIRGELADKNYDLVSDPARFGAFQAHVRKTFGGDKSELINKYYAYHSIDEFITEAMTNAKTQDVLQGIPSIWQKFISAIKDMVARLLGIESDARSLFDDAVDSVLGFIKPPVKGAPSSFSDDIKRVIAKAPKKAAVTTHGNYELHSNAASKKLELSGEITAGNVFSQNERFYILDRYTLDAGSAHDYKRPAINPITGLPSTSGGYTFNGTEYIVDTVKKVIIPMTSYWDANGRVTVLQNSNDVFKYKHKEAPTSTIQYSPADFTNEAVEEEDNTPPFDMTQVSTITLNAPLRPELLGSKESKLNAGQKEAVAKAMKVLTNPLAPAFSKDMYANMFFLSGKGGTGKTYTTEVLLDKIRDINKYGSIVHVAPTWNAVNEILMASDDDKKSASTMASFLGTRLSNPDANGVQKFVLKDIDFNKVAFLPSVFTADYIILDEASMLGGDGKQPSRQGKNLVSTDAWQAFLYRLNERKAELGTEPKKIILVGDYAQIPPVGTLPDHDAPVVEEMLKRPEQFHVLTENMRTGKDDLNKLQEVYRRNIDAARAAIKTGQASNTAIQRNPVPYSTRVDSENIQYLRSQAEAIDKYIDLYKQDPSNTRQIAFVNYNNINNKSTVDLVTRIREGLFGREAYNHFNPGELILLTGNMNSEIQLDGRNKSIEWHNETRFYVEAVGPGITKSISGLEFQGRELTMVTNFGKKRVTFTQFVPDNGEMARVFGQYNDQKKGFDTIYGRFVKYGDYEKIKNLLPAFNYGYVVNSHKVQGSSYEHVFVDEANILASPETNKGFNNMMYTAVSRPKQSLYVLNALNPAEQGVVAATNTAEASVLEVAPGIKSVPNTGLSIDEGNKFIQLLQPYITAQAYKENKGQYANHMFHFGLMWSRKNDSRFPRKGAPIHIVSKAGGNDPYAYTKTDQNGRPMPSISVLAPITGFIEAKLGIDMSDYDSVIANIYEPDNFISEHADTTESASAEKYPVIVLNIGAGGNIVFGQSTSDSTATLLKNGSVYAFGIDGTNRYVRHRTFSGHNAPNPLAPITMPDGRVVQDYRITLTFRRAQDITPGSKPALKAVQSSVSSRKMMIKGDVFKSGMIPIIPTNMGGVHGAGLAQAAKARGLVADGKGEFSANTARVTFPVKQVWKDATNMAIFKDSMTKLFMLARKNPNLKFALPLVGLGHGEGKINEIVPLLAMAVKNNPNITLVLPAENIDLGRPGTVRQDKTRENMPEIIKALADAGVMATPESLDDITADDIITDLIQRGLLKTKCK